MRPSPSFCHPGVYGAYSESYCALFESGQGQILFPTISLLIFPSSFYCQLSNKMHFINVFLDFLTCLYIIAMQLGYTAW